MVMNILARVTLFVIKWSPWVEDDLFLDELVKVKREQDKEGEPK